MERASLSEKDARRRDSAARNRSYLQMRAIPETTRAGSRPTSVRASLRHPETARSTSSSVALAAVDRAPLVGVVLATARGATTDRLAVDAEDRRLRRRGLELDPAVEREVHLDPRVRIELLHDELAARPVERQVRREGARG